MSVSRFDTVTQNLYVTSDDIISLSCTSSTLQDVITISSMQIGGPPMNVYVRHGNGFTPSTRSDPRNYSIHNQHDHHEILVTFMFNLNYTGKYYCIENGIVKNLTILIPLGVIRASTVTLKNAVLINCTSLDPMLPGTMSLSNGTHVSQDAINCSSTRSNLYNITKMMGRKYTCQYSLQDVDVVLRYAAVYLDSNKIRPNVGVETARSTITCTASIYGRHPVFAYWGRIAYSNPMFMHPEDTFYFHNTCGYSYSRYIDDTEPEVCHIRNFIYTDIFERKTLKVFYSFYEYTIEDVLTGQSENRDTSEWNITLRMLTDVRRYGVYTCGICDMTNCYTSTVEMLPQVFKTIIQHPEYDEVRCVAEPIQLPMYFKRLSTAVNDVLIRHVPCGKNSTEIEYSEYFGYIIIASFYTNTSITDNVVCELLIGERIIQNNLKDNPEDNPSTTPHTSGSVNWTVPVTIVIVVGCIIIILIYLYTVRHRLPCIVSL